jgi:hypothetical protein
MAVTAGLSLAGAGSAGAQGAPAWPELKEPTRAGGGEKDAAFIAAVERYAFVAPVPGARANGVDWYNHLVQGRRVPLESVKLLRDEAVTKEKMIRFAREAAAAVKPGGTLWIVFVGHGAPGRGGKSAVLVGVDAQQDADSLHERSLSRSDLLDIAAKSRASRVVAVLDTCFSGRNTEGKPLVAGLQPLVVTGPPAGLDPRVLLFTAAKGNEFAGPLPGGGRPSYSYLVLGALRGWADSKEAGGNGDGRVTAKELHGYTTRALASILTDRTQTPTFEGNAGEALGDAKEKGPDLAAMIARAPAGALGPGASITKRARGPRWTTSPQFGPSIVYQNGVTRTLFGVSADIIRMGSGSFGGGFMVHAGFGAGLINADVGPMFRWSFELGESRRNVPYVRVAIPFRFFRRSETSEFTGESLTSQFYSIGTVLFGGGYRFFVSKNVGIGLDLAFAPTLILSPSIDFVFSFHLGFGVEVRL